MVYVTDRSVHLGNLGTTGKSIENLDNILRPIPLATDRARGGRSTVFDSSIWIIEVVQVLHSNGFIHCPDIRLLEVEYRTIANLWTEGVLKRQHSRIVYVSTVCEAVRP